MIWQKGVSDDAILSELQAYFGEPVLSWSKLDDMDISCAVPLQTQGRHYPFIQEKEGIYFAGDWTTQGSIQGALRSGRLAANLILNNVF